MSEQARRQPAPVIQFLQLIGLWILGSIAGTFMAVVIIVAIWGQGTLMDILSMQHTAAPGFLWAFRVLLAFSSPLIGFLAPALLFNYVISKEPHEHIRLGAYTPAILIVLAAVFMVCFLPTIEVTSFFNEKMTLPAQLGWLDKWIHDTERANDQAFKVVLNMKTPADLIISLILIAGLPAVCEEFFFRGCMQPIFERSTHNKHLAVWITAFIFSAMHMEFLGFLPRLLLGAGLGYLFVWSGTIWPSVAVHFINNGLSVVAEYLYQHKYVATNPDGSALSFQNWVYPVSFVVAVLLLLLYRKVTIQKQMLTYGEELD